MLQVYFVDLPNFSDNAHFNLRIVVSQTTLCTLCIGNECILRILFLHMRVNRKINEIFLSAKISWFTVCQTGDDMKPWLAGTAQRITCRIFSLREGLKSNPTKHYKNTLGEGLEILAIESLNVILTVGVPLSYFIYPLLLEKQLKS